MFMCVMCLRVMCVFCVTDHLADFVYGWAGDQPFIQGIIHSPVVFKFLKKLISTQTQPYYSYESWTRVYRSDLVLLLSCCMIFFFAVCLLNGLVSVLSLFRFLAGFLSFSFLFSRFHLRATKFHAVFTPMSLAPPKKRSLNVSVFFSNSPLARGQLRGEHTDRIQ